MKFHSCYSVWTSCSLSSPPFHIASKTCWGVFWHSPHVSMSPVCGSLPWWDAKAISVASALVLAPGLAPVFTGYRPLTVWMTRQVLFQPEHAVTFAAWWIVFLGVYTEKRNAGTEARKALLRTF
jgi:hypothetical protein